MTSDTVAPTTLSSEQRKIWATGLAKKFSRDFARVMDRHHLPSSLDQDINQLYTFLLWKIDWTVDNDPSYGPCEADYDLAKAGDPEEEIVEQLEKMSLFKRSDVSKFGPTMEIADCAGANYEELVSKVEVRFGAGSDDVLAALDAAIARYIKYSDVLATSQGVAAAIKRVPLEKYLPYRGWSGGLVVPAGFVWCGEEWPQDGTTDEVAIAAAIVNDLYDYPRDVLENTHLNVWHYFDSVEDAIPYVEKYWYDVYDRVDVNLKEWMDRFLVYQQDEEMQSLRGFDRRWYDRLNKTFH